MNPDFSEHTHEHLGHHHEAGAAHGSGGATGRRILTVRAVAGLAGDMMLSGLAALAGITQDELNVLVEELRLPGLEGSIRVEQHHVHGVQGWKARIDLPHEHAHRTCADIVAMIDKSAMPEDAKALSVRAFRLLAEAEAAVHGSTPEAVTFHEVGALDSIVDTCLVCRLFVILRPDIFVCSPLPLADGVIHCAHGHMPSPAPAVLRLLSGVPVCGFAGQGETVTPTALSLLKALDARFGNWPEMVVEATAISYGGKVFENAPNGAVWATGKGWPGRMFI